MEGEWTILPRGDVAAHWSGLYVTLNKIGTLAMSRVTHERLGSPEAFMITWNRFAQKLALKPVVADSEHAYPARKYGRRGAKVVRAYRLVAQFGIRPPDTIEFIEPKIDTDGQLILDLRNIRISPKAHSQCRRNDIKQGDFGSQRSSHLARMRS